MSTTTITLRINADGSAAITSLDRVGAAAGKAGKEAEEGGRRGARGIKETSDAARDAARRVGSLTDFVKGLAGAWLSFQGVKALVSMADQAAGLSARLRLASDSQREFNIAQSETFAIAQRTTTALESTVNLYARLRQSTQDYGIQQTRLLALTETINQTFAVSGTEAAAQANAITQLTQAFAGGVLRAEEFNSVIENSPRLAKAFADGLGVSMGALRKMVNDGEVDIARMIAALEDQAGAIAKEYAQIPLTVERAWTQLTNAVLRYVGDADSASGASRKLAGAVAYVAENIKILGDALLTVAQIVAVHYGVRMVSAFTAATTGLAGLANSLRIVTAAFAGWQVGTWLREQFLEAELAGIALVNGLLVGWERLKQGAQIAFAGIQLAWGLLIGGMGDLWAGFVNLVADGVDLLPEKLGGGHAQSMRDYAESIGGTAAALQQFQDRVDRANQVAEAQIGLHREITDAMAADAIAKNNATTAADGMADATQKNTAAAVANVAATKERLAALEALVRIERSLIDQAFEAAAAGEPPDVQAHLEYEAVVRQVSEQLGEMARQAVIAKEGADALADAERAATQVIEAAARARDKKLAALAKERDIVAQVLAAHQAEAKELQLSGRALAMYRAETDLLSRAAAQNVQVTQEQIETVRAAASANHDLAESQSQVAQLLSEFGDEAYADPIFDMVDGMKQLHEEIKRLQNEPILDADALEEAQRALERMNAQVQIKMVGSFRALLGSAQAFTKEGSRGFQAMEVGMAALSIVQDIIALKAGVTAVLSQGQGEPYSAWARMAAMAAAVAPFLASIGQTLSSFGGSGGGFTDTAAERQASQGTGTVLGDSEAKSESILNATEITAEATTELVGINRGMLRALIQLQDGIAGATTMLARGAGDIEFDRIVIQPLQHAFLGSIFTPMLRFLSGGSQVTDRGIMIGGGGVGSLNPQAYQEEQYRTWRFGSRRTREQTAALPDDVAAQFDLIMDSIVSTVREGALALGLLPEEIEAAIAAYQVEVTRISLEDLNAEEQQAELEAVFSSIFDGLAGHVVPFIAQFQEVGEGLGETLVRVATSVQVVQESMRYLGLAIDETDPERFAQISVALIDAAGGIEEFITGMQAFANAFAPEEFQFESNASALRDAFEQAGLAVPATREAMWDLMQSLDATTEEGREHIAMLLRLGDTAADYYRALERQNEAAERAAEIARRAPHDYAVLIDSFTQAGAFRNRIREVQEEERQAIARANELARAAGMQGVAERHLALIHRRTADQITAIIRELEQAIGDIAGQLYGGTVQQEIEDFQAGAVGAIGEIDNAMRQMYDAQLAAIQRIEDYLIQMQFGGLSALSPTEQLDAARQQLEVLQLAAQAGDADAMAALPQAAQQYLQLLQGAFASGDEFGAGYEWVRELLQGIVDAGPTVEPGEENGVWNGYPGLTPETLAERDTVIAGQEAEHRAFLAQQLVEHVAALAQAQRESALAVLDRTLEQYGGTIQELVRDLGGDLDNLTGRTVEVIAGLAHDLGVPLVDLVEHLGLDLPDLAGGVRELAEQIGIDIPAMTGSVGGLTAAMVGQLGTLAGNLRTDLSTISQVLGLELGELTDVESPIFRALSDAIGTLPEGQAEALQAHLADIAAAAGDEDRNRAVAALRAAVQSGPLAIREQLAPFFEGMAYPELTDLNFLSAISTDQNLSRLALEGVKAAAESTDAQLVGIGSSLEAIRNNLSAANQDAGVPHYAAGGWVNSRTTLVAGEAGRELILPNHVSEFLLRTGIPVVGGGADPAVVAELRRIGERVDRLDGSIGQRIERVEAAVSTADRNNVQVTERTAQDTVIRRSGAY